MSGRRVLVTGATGNLGSRLVERLIVDPRVELVIGVARRRPARSAATVVWRELDLAGGGADQAKDPLDELLEGVDTVVHLAWIIQPTRDPRHLWDVNVRGTARLLSAIGRSSVSTLLYASSVGAFSPRQHPGQVVDESWPTHGVATSTYSVAKAYVERLLDAFERRHPAIRVVRMRPGLMLQRHAAAHVRRLFFGAAVPNWLFAPGRIPVVPDVPGLQVSVVHSSDAAEAFRLAVHAEDAVGAFNLAAPDAVSARDLAQVLEARTVTVPASVARGGVTAAWWGRLTPIDAGWFDLAYGAPLLDAGRATRDLGWRPKWRARAAVAELFQGLAVGAGRGEPPLEPDDRRSRLEELVTSLQGRHEVR